MNETDFSLTSLILQNNDYRSRYDSYIPHLSEFFIKHCSDLKSLELTNWLNPEYDHDLLKIASRTVSSFSGIEVQIELFNQRTHVVGNNSIQFQGCNLLK